MNKEPIGLYIFRFVLGFALFSFMCMLYWSSLLLEENVKDLKENVNQLKGEVSDIRTDIHSRNTIQSESSEKSTPTSPRQSSARPYIDPSIPNILQEDPFYIGTLPKLLPPNFVPHGTFHSALVGKPNNLHPFSNWVNVSTWIEMCTGSVARLQFGKYESFAPDFAIKMEERLIPGTNVPEFWIHLREGLFWKPLSKEMFSQNINLASHFLQKHPVTADDFKFYFDAMMNPYNQESGAASERTYYEDIQDIKVIDDLTFVVRWKTVDVEVDGKMVPRIKYRARQLTGGMRPLASFVYKYFPDGKKILEDDSDPEIYRTSSVWAQNFSQHWAKNIIPSCGGWLFERLTDQQISFKRNPDYFFTLGVLGARSENYFKDAPDLIWQDFKANKIDTYNLQPDQIIELEQFLASDLYRKQKEQGASVQRLDYLARQYAYIGWNQARPFFKSKKVRQALTMAIDRQRIIKEFLNGMGVEITGTFFRNSPSYDLSIQPWPFDLARARRQLLEEGWIDSDGDGIVDKTIDGKRISFKYTLTYYVKNPIGKSICEYISSAMKEIGIQCNLNGVDIADISNILEDKSFDALMLGWALGTPPEDPKQLWFSAGAKEKGSSNSVGFANAEADKIISALQYEYNPELRIKLYHRFDQIIHEEQPYTFLYSPKTALLYREYVQNVFIPADRQDLVPGANVAEPISSIFWLKDRPGK